MGFISHVGKNTGCGHYVAHIRKDGRWAIFDDRKVLVLCLEKAFVLAVCIVDQGRYIVVEESAMQVVWGGRGVDGGKRHDQRTCIRYVFVRQINACATAVARQSWPRVPCEIRG